MLHLARNRGFFVHRDQGQVGLAPPTLPPCRAQFRPATRHSQSLRFKTSISMLWFKLRGICIQLPVLIGCYRKRSLSWLWATLPLPNSMGSPRDWREICNRLLMILHGWGQLEGGWFLWLTSYRPVHSNESFDWFDSETILQILPAHISICIDLSLPSNIHSHVRPIGLNAGVDAVLRNIFDNSSMFNRNRVIFTSFNPDICAALNWKQPNCKASI